MNMESMGPLNSTNLLLAKSYAQMEVDAWHLGQIHRNHPQVHKPLLEQAFEQADPKTIPVIVFQLQNLLSG